MEKVINTPCGQIKGTDCRIPGVIAYKGIRYATAKRWEYPSLVESWEGIYDATKYGNCSYQPRSFYDEEYNEKKYFYYNEFRKGETYTYDDDCLFLNIWTPETATPGRKLPVLVYIHGGGFTGGCAHEKHFDDPIWPANDVVAVTINYRLGPMGFMCLPELEAEAGHTGNYGLYDQMMALQWVKKNIESFGGDPDEVTIMGQSAGAMSVQHLCQSPLTDGLFNKAVMSSGCMTMDILTSSPVKAGEFWQEVMARLGCNTLEEFRAVPAEKLFDAWQTAKKELKGGMMTGVPVKDELFIVSNPKVKDIPYMIGSTSEDMMPPFLYSMGKKWATKNKVTSYGWFFDRKLPGDDNGAWHSSDLWYWFGTLDRCWRPMTEKDYKLSNEMVAYLMSFVKTGNPNQGTGCSGNCATCVSHSGLPMWEPVNASGKLMRFGEGSTRMGKASMIKLIKTMLTNKAVGE